MREVNSKSTFVSADGGVLDFVDSDGQLLVSVAVPPGRIPASGYLDICPYGAEIQVSKGLYVINPPSWHGLVPTPETHFESGANPDYKPRILSDNELQTRQMMDAMKLRHDTSIRLLRDELKMPRGKEKALVESLHQEKAPQRPFHEPSVDE